MPPVSQSNHCGMETLNEACYLLKSLKHRLNRTIVEWKPLMKTISHSLAISSQSNHCGMETLHLPPFLHPRVGLNRTIVEWKLGNFTFKAVAKDNNGLNRTIVEWKPRAINRAVLRLTGAGLNRTIVEWKPN